MPMVLNGERDLFTLDPVQQKVISTTKGGGKGSAHSQDRAGPPTHPGLPRTFLH